MIKVVLLGAGNVAIHLAKAFSIARNIDFVQRYSRNNKNQKYFNSKIPVTNDVQNLAKADVYTVAINDDSISEFSKTLSLNEGLILHTSGSIPLTALTNKLRRGVFYPLQSFSKNQELDFKNIPVAIETEFESDKELLNNLACSISNNVYNINSKQREKLHMAAVFANNFSNYMFTIAKNICDENNFSFDILKPLIIETANKLKYLDPEQAQTGPATRNDKKVIEKHLSQLKKEKKEIYSLISDSIIGSN
jgi:predicted short-subunit dehydrogenase-like oxidoreductase (DUF2520 family)